MRELLAAKYKERNVNQSASLIVVLTTAALMFYPLGVMSSNAQLIFTPTSSSHFHHPTNVSAQGSGSFTCPGNPVTFTASEKGPVVTGTWALGGGAESGTFSSGKISKDAYILNGVQDKDNVCGASLPSRITISGQLGQGVTIHFTAANGITGTFTGNVVSF